MRKQIPSSPVMREREAMHPPAALCKLDRDIENFSVRARSVAISCYALSSACFFHCNARDIRRDIASRLFGIVGLLSTLSTQLKATTTHDQSIFQGRQLHDLERDMAACSGVLDEIDRNEFGTPDCTTMGHCLACCNLRVFTPDELADARDTLQALFDSAAKMTVAATLQDTERYGKITNTNTLESRLIKAHMHENFHTISESEISPTASEAAPQTTNIPQILKGSFGSFPLHNWHSSSQPYSLEQPRPQSNKDIPIWAYNRWPPYRATSNNYEEDQRQMPPGMGGDPGKNEALPAKENLRNTSASTREGTRAVAPGDGDRAGKPDTPGLNASVWAGADKADETTSVMPPEINHAPTAKQQEKKDVQLPAFGQGTTSKADTSKVPQAFRFGPLHHLEAYILRPCVDVFLDRITWTPKIELLHLDEYSMQAHLNKLGPDYSIIDAMGELPPDQISLIQARTKSRNGRLVSVQQGAPTDMVTQMGTFQIKPVIFIITTAALPEEGPQTVTDFKPSQSYIPGGRSPYFVPPQPIPPAVPRTNSPFPRDPPMHGTYFDSTDAYQAYLQERGEDCFRVEQGNLTPRGMQRYMTITTGDRYSRQDRSLEEIRIEDYKAGRTGPMKTNSFFYPWENPFTRETGSEKPFGGQYSRSAPGNGASSGISYGINGPPRTGGLFGNAFGGGLFGGKPTSSGGLFGQQPQPTRGLFGNAPSGGSLFGGKPASSGGPFGSWVPFGQHSQQSQGLFGNGPAGGGLLGNVIRPEQQSQQPGGLFGKPSNSSNLFTKFGANPDADPDADAGFSRNHAPPASGLFGTAPPISSSSSFFGPPTNTTSPGLFGTRPSTSITSNKALPPPNTGLFGGARSIPSGHRLFGPGLFGQGTNVPSTSVPATTLQPVPGHVIPAGQQPQGTSSSFFGAPKPSAFTPSPTNNPFAHLNPPRETASTTQNATSPSLFGTNPFTSIPSSSTIMRPDEIHDFDAPRPNTCTKCAIPLAHHSAAELLFALCDVCQGNKTTACWLCERRIQKLDTRIKKTPASKTQSDKEKRKQDGEDEEKKKETRPVVFIAQENGTILRQTRATNDSSSPSFTVYRAHSSRPPTPAPASTPATAPTCAPTPVSAPSKPAPATKNNNANANDNKDVEIAKEVLKVYDYPQTSPSLSSFLPRPQEGNRFPSLPRFPMTLTGRELFGGEDMVPAAASGEGEGDGAVVLCGKTDGMEEGEGEEKK